MGSVTPEFLKQKEAVGCSVLYSNPWQVDLWCTTLQKQVMYAGPLAPFSMDLDML